MKKRILIISLTLICIVGVVCFLFYNGTIELPNSSNVDIQIEENNEPLISNEILNSKAPETEKEKEDLYKEVKTAITKKYDDKSIYSITTFTNFENSKNIIEKQLYFNLKDCDIALQEYEYYIFPLGAKKSSKIANQYYIDFNDKSKIYRGEILESFDKEKFNFETRTFGFKTSEKYAIDSFEHYKNLYFSLYQDAFFENFVDKDKVSFAKKVIAEKDENKISIFAILPTNEKRVISEIFDNKIYIYDFSTFKLKNIINYNPKADLIKYKDSLNKIVFEHERNYDLFEKKVFEEKDRQENNAKALVFEFEQENGLTNQKNEVLFNIPYFLFEPSFNSFKFEIVYDAMLPLYIEGKYEYYPRLSINSFEIQNIETGKKLFYKKSNPNILEEIINKEKINNAIVIEQLQHEIFLDKNNDVSETITKIVFNINYEGLDLKAEIVSLETNFNLKSERNYICDVEKTLTITTFSQKVSGNNEYYSKNPVSFTHKGTQIEDNLINKIS